MRHFISAALLCLAAIVLSPPARGEPSENALRRPNVVVLFPDQLRWAELGCYGHTVVRTPNEYQEVLR